jgi:hypothetical protein
LRYAFQVKPHANARYALSMEKLARIECQCLLYALKIPAAVSLQKLAGTPFLIVETDALDEGAWETLSQNAGVSFAAQMEGEWLKPLPLTQASFLDADLAQILKYKGKTNADFTLMMLHCAKAASAFALDAGPLTVLDPICGRGTALFCALQEGDNAVGIEQNDKDVHEADTYFKRYLLYHRRKHERETLCATLPAGRSAQEIRYRLYPEGGDRKKDAVRTLRLFCGDAAYADRMAGRESCHLLAADLPYGVQHAPRAGKSIATHTQLMQSAFPAWHAALKPGGAAAVAFNTFTLRRESVCAALQSAGFQVLTEPPFDDFSHWVEQAVNRDMVLALKR